MVRQVPLRVLELLASRLCHDLVGPVGAINNGLELLDDEGGASDPDFMRDAVGLAMESGQKAAALLKFFRIAHGAAGSVTEVKPDVMRELSEAYLTLHKIKLDWREARGAGHQGGTVVAMRPEASGAALHDVDQGIRAKLVLNLVSTAAQALPRGGSVLAQVGGGGVGEPTLTLTAMGEGARFSEELSQSFAIGARAASATGSLDQAALDGLDARTITAF
ncbi:MAG: histidine phosphotransferase family protein, partial [Pseudomonadota bacterium]